MANEDIFRLNSSFVKKIKSNVDSLIASRSGVNNFTTINSRNAVKGNKRKGKSAILINDPHVCLSPLPILQLFYLESFEGPAFSFLHDLQKQLAFLEPSGPSANSTTIGSAVKPGSGPQTQSKPLTIEIFGVDVALYHLENNDHLPFSHQDSNKVLVPCWSMALDQCYASFTGLNHNDREDLQPKLEMLGCFVTGSLSPQHDLLITNEVGRSKKYLFAGEQRIPILHSDFIDDLWKLAPKYPKFNLKRYVFNSSKLS